MYITKKDDVVKARKSCMLFFLSEVNVILIKSHKKFCSKEMCLKAVTSAFLNLTRPCFFYLTIFQGNVVSSEHTVGETTL